jgi:2-keto-4-pentenoate hydratase/2-oxohepta-3-ene-1,7-dioic acid hydratase in catechol pathway
MAYYWLDGEQINLPVGKAVCVGRNYAQHAHELGNAVPSEPLLFIKPATSIVCPKKQHTLNHLLGQHHYEAELTLLIGQPLNQHNIDNYMQCIRGVGIGLDLTLRELQTELKNKGYPWEKAKAFDNSCIVSSFIPASEVDLNHTEFELKINGHTRQLGNTELMLFKIEALLKEIVIYFSLQPGDIILTGTPAGVGELYPIDQLDLFLNGTELLSFEIN